jgi:hypothetical protein
MVRLESRRDPTEQASGATARAAHRHQGGTVSGPAMSRRSRGYLNFKRHRHRFDPAQFGPRCRQCKTPLLNEQDQEIGYCYDCWAKLSNMSSDGILAFISKRHENDN